MRFGSWRSKNIDQTRRLGRGISLLSSRFHFMPASLLESQLATLEPLQPDEPGIAVPADEHAVERVLAWA